ncbi:MAG: VCBS repeat-containing protein [Myxococcota bacterium]
MRRLLLLSFVLIACGGDDDGPLRPCETTSECSEGFICRDNVCVDSPPTMDAGVDAARDAALRDAGEPPCVTDEQCGEGVCVSGECCESEERVCGESCCSGAEVCFANACVVPGTTCRSAEDCDEGQYCEPSLGDGPSDMDAGVPDAGGMVCLGAAPSAGRCLDLPPRCAGEEPEPGEVCITDCEFRPPVENLDAVPQWVWGPDVETNAGRIDVWATPAVARVTDTNCDGVVDEFDPPNVIFVSGNAQGTCCSCGAGNETTCKTGVLRVVDGVTGEDVWSLRRPRDGSLGFSGLSVALGDVDHDGDMEIAAVDGEGQIVLVDHTGAVVATSDQPITGFTGNNVTGWGGGLSIADMDHDGNPEIAYGRSVFTTDGTTITRLWEGTGSWGRALTQAISVFVQLDDDADLEVLAGRTAYEPNGTIKWQNTDVPTGFSAPANFDADPEAEVVHVANGSVYLLSAADGSLVVPAIAATGSDAGNGGPPTIADFDGDGSPEIGVAWRNNYEVFQLNAAGDALESVWATPNHDFSSSVTGSTVFDFEGDGAAEVIYNDECFLWVYDGATGRVRFATPTTSFTATEASLVADVDGDGSAEIVMVSNGANPAVGPGWDCDGLFNGTDWTQPAAPGAPDEGRPGWVGSDGVAAGGAAYRGLTVFRARDNSWVGTRSLWNQHAYSVSNICGDRGDACSPPSTYGDIPVNQVDNWSVDFLNNFRQNIQGEGIFDAPDAVVSLRVVCETPTRLVAAVRNLGAAVLPEGVTVGFFVREGGGERMLGMGTTTTRLFPGQVANVEQTTDTDPMATFFARILVDPDRPVFQECRGDNNESEDATGRCLL